MKPIRPLAILLLITCLSAGVSAQNMVPNGDFETYNDCPDNLSGIAFSATYSNFPTATYWTNPLRNSSPDYFNSCAPGNTGVKVPMSLFGYQQAYDGNAYAGIIAWDGQYNGGGMPVFDYREYIQTRLTQAMMPGHSYCVSFYVSPTVSPGFSFNYVGIDQIGLNFSDTQVVNDVDYSLSLPLDISNPPGSFLSDTSKWYKVQGVYVANGGERWLTAGCFKNGNNPPAYTQLFPPVADPNLSYRCYLYLDGFSIKEITSADTIRVSHDTVVCHLTGLSMLLAGQSSGLGFQWNTGSQAAGIVATDTGTYWCRSAVECGMVIDTFHIDYLPTTKLNLGNDIANCYSQPVAIASNGIYDTYLWNTGASAPAITVNQSGVYTLTVSSFCGIQQDSIEVSIQQPTATPLVSDTTICQFVQDPILNVAGSDIRWYSNSLGGVGMPVQPPIFTGQYGDYTWYVTQTIGQCESPKVPLHIKIEYTPKADIGDYYALCVNTDTVLLGKEYPDVDYRWNTSEFVCCIIPHETGTYQLTISNECGESSDTAFVEISTCDDCLFLPNAFTPNNDGRNDHFMPVVKCPVINYKMSLFNRWGQEIFTTADVNKGWNGSMGGKLADAGVYVYVMEFTSVTTGLKKMVHGNVSLIR